MRAELKIPALTELVLSHGSHSDRADGVCLMEAVAWFAGEEHSDAPACCSPVLAAFFRSWNDGMRTDDERAQLKQYVPLLVGTDAGPAVEQKRGWMALDWLMRVQSVEWLHQAGLDHHATALAALPALPEINNGPIDDESRKRIQAARAAAEAAAGDVWAAAWAAAGDAAWAAAGAAAGAAARDAAGAAALAAARDAALVAAGAAAGAAAGDAALVAAGDAALVAAGAAAWAAAGAAAGDAAKTQLEPSVEVLQASAHNLARNMIDA